MNDAIVLDEYESTVTPLSLDDVAALRALVGFRLSVTAADTPGDWVIRASSYVGTVVVGAVRVLVRPKVSNSQPVSYSSRQVGPALDVRPEAFDYDAGPGDLVPAFATFFAASRRDGARAAVSASRRTRSEAGRAASRHPGADRHRDTSSASSACRYPSRADTTSTPPTSR